MIKRLFFIPLFVLAFVTSASWAASIDSAKAMIQNTSDKMIAALQQEKDNIKANPRRVYALVDEIVLPNFDFERMSKYVLGKNWNTATPDQQQRFTKEFRDLLVRTYATALVEAAVENVKVNYLPVRAQKDTKLIMLQTQVEYGGKTLAVDYDMYLKGNEWKVWNVHTEGVSLVANYRTEFNNDVSTIGMDKLIQKIASRNQDALKGSQ